MEAEKETEKRRELAAERFLREVECGCGDIRFAGDMCHICGRCQIGCCMCVEPGRML